MTPYSFTQVRHSLPFYALRTGHPWSSLIAVSGVAHRAGCLGPSSTPLDTPRCKPMPVSVSWIIRNQHGRFVLGQNRKSQLKKKCEKFTFKAIYIRFFAINMVSIFTIQYVAPYIWVVQNWIRNILMGTFKKLHIYQLQFPHNIALS
jgi:hypothetical protein